MASNKIYLDLDWKTKQFKHWSKSDLGEGYVPKENGEGYEKFFNTGVTGVLQNVDLKDSNFGPRISIVLKSAEGVYQVCQLGLLDNKGFVENNFAEPLIMVLGNMKKGETYTIFPYEFKAADQKTSDIEAGNQPKEKYYDKTGISVKTADGEKVPWYLSYTEGTDKSIPKLDWKEDSLTKKRKPSAASKEERSDFFKAEFARCKDGHLAFGGSNTPSDNSDVDNFAKENEAAQTTSKKSTTSNAPVEEYDDDLPF